MLYHSEGYAPGIIYRNYGQPLTSRTVKIRAAQGMEESQIGRGGSHLVRVRSPSINIGQLS